MKNFMLILLVFFMTSCEIPVGFHSDRNTRVGFFFTDKDGNDIFTDSLSLEDFSISTLEGMVGINHIDTIYNKTYFEISFLDDGDERAVALFQFKEDADTVVVTFKKDYRYIRNLYYNGNHVNFDTAKGNLCTIIK